MARIEYKNMKHVVGRIQFALEEPNEFQVHCSATITHSHACTIGQNTF